MEYPSPPSTVLDDDCIVHPLDPLYTPPHFSAPKGLKRRLEKSSEDYPETTANLGSSSLPDDPPLPERLRSQETSIYCRFIAQVAEELFKAFVPFRTGTKLVHTLGIIDTFSPSQKTI
jgi:hypothetical protein